MKQKQLKTIIALCAVVLLVMTAGCTQREIKENQVYVVGDVGYGSKTEEFKDELHTEGRIPFQVYQGVDYGQYSEEGWILITVSPDRQVVFFAEAIKPLEHEGKVLLGNDSLKVRLFAVDRESEEQWVVTEEMPFVSRVQWNGEGNRVAFGGDNRLTIYDLEQRRLLMDEKLANEQVTFFSWAPGDENKIYSEQPNLVNGSIYYINSQKKVEAYDTRESIYYKGKLDNNYYYGTKWDLVEDSLKTVIADKQGNLIKVLGSGVFRDSYKKGIVMVGEWGFGLHYKPDVDEAQNTVKLTDEYVYDVKFVDKGKIAYTVKSPGVNNSFYLHIADQRGRELNKFEVSGAEIALTPDGALGYIGGYDGEVVNFSEVKITDENWHQQTFLIDEFENEIISTLRGAGYIISQYELIGHENWKLLDEYFTDTDSPEQWGKYDMRSRFSQGETKKYGKAIKKFQAQVILKELITRELDWQTRVASAVINVSGENNAGDSMDVDYAIELVREDQGWKVTGFSTFPHWEQREEVEKAVSEAVEYYRGELGEGPVQLGQIQFIRSGIMNWASNVERADLCQVYLLTEDEGAYKLTLQKTPSARWLPLELEKVGYAKP
ncbi:hypothetical protein GGQ84_000696 [Desulfitispora alkaliphila]|uniref:hypothetical protein n=1 Tax=Desulfitispora alkaliphila TaxID=622674 RepID=UPI003D1E0C08